MANDAGPEARQFALAAAAILTTLTRRDPRHDLLGGAPKTPESEATAKTILQNSWNIDGREALLGTLGWLTTQGQTSDYVKTAQAYAEAGPDQRQQDPSLTFVNQYGAEIGQRGLLAWDLGRACAVAGWGYLAGYCSEEEAWQAVLPAGARLRATYKSWAEFSQHYRLGALFWDATAVQSIDPVLAQLEESPNSPWKKVAWSLAPAGTAVSPFASTAYGGFPPPSNAASANAAVFPGSNGAVVSSAAPLPPTLGSPGAPLTYSGVPVIAPPPGGAPMPIAPLLSGMQSRIPPRKKLLLLAILGAGAIVLLIIAAVIWHFVHKETRESPPRETPHEPAREHGKHGRK